jgi:hypothetical protein
MQEYDLRIRSDRAENWYEGILERGGPPMRVRRHCDQYLVFRSGDLRVHVCVYGDAMNPAHIRQRLRNYFSGDGRFWREVDLSE